MSYIYANIYNTLLEKVNTKGNTKGNTNTLLEKSKYKRGLSYYTIYKRYL